MKYHISIHITPYEIDDYQTFIHQLRRNLNYINSDVIFNPCLNLSNYFYDWKNSILNSEYFITKFKTLNNTIKSNSIIVDEIVNFDNQILGALSYKRYFIKKYKNEIDAFIWFDSDMIFPDDTLYTLVNAFEHVDYEYCIITPQLSKMWDKSWDIIVNKEYLSENPHHQSYLDFDPYTLYTHNETKSLSENQQYTKFGSGWCNLISSGIFKKYINLTENLGHYGIDDTFIMYALDMYKQKNPNIKQFIVDNLIVSENNKFKLSLYKDLINSNLGVKTKEEFRLESEQGMINELNRLKNENIF
jgi:hypothetical protein